MADFLDQYKNIDESTPEGQRVAALVAAAKKDIPEVAQQAVNTASAANAAATKYEERWKKYSKWCPKWRPFRHFELPLGHLGPLLEGPGVKISCPRPILCTL